MKATLNQGTNEAAESRAVASEKLKTAVKALEALNKNVRK